MWMGIKAYWWVSRREVADPTNELVTRGISHGEELWARIPFGLRLLGGRLSS